MKPARAGISVYVAVVAHLLLALVLVTPPSAQWPAGPQAGLSRLTIDLGPSPSDLPVTAGSAPVPMETKRPETTRMADPAPVRVAPRTAAAAVVEVPLPAEAASPSEPAPASSGRVPKPAAGRTFEGGGRGGYLARLRQHLAGHRQVLPLPVGRAGGEAVVEVSIDPGGWPASVVLVRSSGLPALDHEAVAIFQRAAPLPAPPDGGTLRLQVPIRVGERESHP